MSDRWAQPIFLLIFNSTRNGWMQWWVPLKAPKNRRKYDYFPQKSMISMIILHYSSKIWSRWSWIITQYKKWIKTKKLHSDDYLHAHYMCAVSVVYFSSIFKDRNIDYFCFLKIKFYFYIHQVPPACTQNKWTFFRLL